MSIRQMKISKSITNRSEASLDKYLVEVGREELLTVDEEVELAQRIHQGTGTLPATESQLDKESLDIELYSLLHKMLTQKEIDILLMTYGIGTEQKTLNEIGSSLGLTVERVRQIREKSLVKLRQYSNSSRPFLR